jgi:predicted enzyme related to lactoylglutathione lyase
MPNPVVRWQIISPEPDQSAGFYQKLFAWKLSQANALGYRELLSGNDVGIDGGVWPAPPGVKGFVQLFVEVPDLDACIARATGLGAQILIPNSVLPDGDTMAVLLDPTGLSFGVCQLKPKT